MSKSITTRTGLGLALLATAFIGCGEPDKATVDYGEAAESDGSHGGHSHAHEEGPHGGKILELASDHSVHGELCLDEGGKSLTFYVLGSDLKTPKPAMSCVFEIEEGDDEKKLPTTAKPLDGEEEGKCSCYSIDVSELKEVDLDHMHAHVHVIIDGLEYEGGLEHDHDHAHGDHGDHDDHAHGDGDKHDHDDHDHKDDHSDHDHDKEDHAETKEASEDEDK